MAAEQRRLATLDVQEDSLHLVRLIAHRHEQLIAGTRQLLVSLAHVPAVSGGDPAACSALLATLLQGYPAYLNLGVMQPDGTLVCSALPFSAPVNVADRAYVRRALETRDFAIGDFQIGRLTGKPSVGFGYPIRSATGAVQAVLFAALDLAWLKQLTTAVRLPTSVTLTVIDHQGTVLARYPDPHRWLGQAAHDAPLVQRLLAHGEEGTTTTTGLDGVPRVYAFTRLRGASHGGEAYVSLGVPTAVVFAQANQLLTYQLAGLGLMTVLAFGGTWAVGEHLILRRVRTLVRATQGLAAGDLSVRTGMSYGHDEFGHLARAFDDMAAAWPCGKMPPSGRLRRRSRGTRSACASCTRSTGRCLRRKRRRQLPGR